MWSAVGGCWLFGQPRVVASSRHDSGGPSGDTWEAVSLPRDAEESSCIVI